jgi:hypothetical protein
MDVVDLSVCQVLKAPGGVPILPYPLKIWTNDKLTYYTMWGDNFVL